MDVEKKWHMISGKNKFLVPVDEAGSGRMRSKQMSVWARIGRKQSCGWPLEHSRYSSAYGGQWFWWSVGRGRTSGGGIIDGEERYRDTERKERVQSFFLSFFSFCFLVRVKWIVKMLEDVGPCLCQKDLTQMFLDLCTSKKNKQSTNAYVCALSPRRKQKWSCRLQTRNKQPLRG